jgi:hypothetical protein
LVSATLDLINAKIRDIFNTLGVDATTLSIITISIMTLSIITISITTLSITFPHNDTHHNNNQQNDFCITAFDKITIMKA